MKKKLTQQITTSYISSEGELIEKNDIQSFSVEREPDYIKLYLNDILRINEIPKSGGGILFSILRRMTYNNDVALYAPIKEEIANELNIKQVTISKAIELFVEKSILIRKARGLYILNPYFFGKGRWEDIKKIRLSVEYSKKGKMILKTEFSTSEQLEIFENENIKKVSSNSESGK